MTTGEQLLDGFKTYRSAPTDTATRAAILARQSRELAGLAMQYDPYLAKNTGFPDEFQKWQMALTALAVIG